MRTNITIDSDTIRRFHSIAKELASLADSLGRHGRSVRIFRLRKRPGLAMK